MLIAVQVRFSKMKPSLKPLKWSYMSHFGSKLEDVHKVLSE